MEMWGRLVLLAVIATASVPTLFPTSRSDLDFSGRDPVLPSLCIAWTSPAEGEDNVSLGRPIVVAFCEPPDLTFTWFSLTPSAEPYLVVWSNGDTVLTIQHLRPFEPCTRYWATIGSDSGQYTWTFFTVCAFAPPDDLTIRRM